MFKVKQTEQLIQYFKTVEPRITQLVAGKVLGIDRLASRIFDLKQLGYMIAKATKKDFAGKRYTEYLFLG
jgi:hypothetical protein